MIAALGVVTLTALPADASTTIPRPRNEEWWFAAWSVQDKVWPHSRGKGVTVAVIDSGVNAHLPDLKGKILRGIDIDTKSGDGRKDLRNHGTGMASLIVGQGHGTRMVGVAPEAKVLPISITYSDRYADAIRYAVDHGADVINISSSVGYPGGCMTEMEAISYAAAKDVPIVAAAGNGGDTTNFAQMPAGCAGVLAVGAVDNEKNVWPGSTRKPYVAVAAPGQQVGDLSKKGRFQVGSEVISPKLNRTIRHCRVEARMIG